MNKTYIKKSENGGFSETNATEGLRKTIGELVSKMTVEEWISLYEKNIKG